MKEIELKNDILRSKSIIEDLIGKEIQSFCVPFNSYNPSVFRNLVEIGYKNIFIQKQYCIQSDILHKYLIQTHTIYRYNSLSSIHSLLNTGSDNNNFVEKVIQFCSNATIGVKELV